MGADISASSDPILIKLCSLDSSHQGESHGGTCVRFEALYLELFAISHFYINVTQTILLITYYELRITFSANQLRGQLYAVPHSNRKIIELDLTRRYNTTQALRHIIDGWKDPRFNIDTNAFDDLITDPKLRTILSGWYVTESSSIFIDNQEFEDESDGKILLSIIDR